MNKGRVLTITDDLGNIDGIVLKDEICLLLPYAEELLGPMLKNELMITKISSKIRHIPKKEIIPPERKTKKL